MKVLLLGCGGPAARGVANCLRAKGHFVHGADADREALWFYDGHARDVLDPDDDEALLSLVGRVKPDIIHAQPDEEVARVSRLRGAIRSRGCAVFLPRSEVIKTCQDKLRTHDKLHRCKVPVPRSDEAAWLFDLGQTAPKVHVRPRTGAGGKGSFSGTVQEAQMWLTRHDAWKTWMAAEHLPGPTVTWQAIYQHGRLVVAQTRARLAWTNGDRGSAAVSETVTDDRAVEVAEHAIRAIDLMPHGIYGVDMTLDAYHMPRVTEINIGRFFTTIEFFKRLGVNFPDIAVRCGTGETVAEIGKNPLPDGKRWLRSFDHEPVLV